jgi:hypothetical protein
MINYTFRPLQWDRESTPVWERRSRSTFKAGWSQTLNLLRRELEHLDAEQVVIEAGFRESDIRIDGMPKGNAPQPAHPGVRIAFNSRHGALVYATDTHDYWQHNVRAIALALEALRSVDRYGVTKRAEQYRGWKAIGSGTPMPGGPGMTRRQAADFISEHAIESPLSGRPVFTPDEVFLNPGKAITAYRIAARRLHPDTGGSAAEFQQLQHAKTALNGDR